MVMRGQLVAQEGDPLGEASVEGSSMDSAQESLERFFRA
jgi:hypothetical protein